MDCRNSKIRSIGSRATHAETIVIVKSVATVECEGTRLSLQCSGRLGLENHKVKLSLHDVVRSCLKTKTTKKVGV